MDEDVFDEDASEMSIIEKDWKKLNRSQMKDGFVAGSTAGQESTLQSGFNFGFKQGFESSFLLAEIRGVLNALMSYRASYEGHPITDDVILDAQQLLDDILQLEADCVAEDFFTMKINVKAANNYIHDSNYENIDATHSSFAALSMDVDETSRNNSSPCGESRENSFGMKLCSRDQLPLSSSEPTPHGIRKPPTDISSSSSERHSRPEMNLEEVKKLLLSCPEIQQIVQRCKHILKRLRWTDAMIDNLI